MKALIGNQGILEEKTVLNFYEKLSMIDYVDEVIYIKMDRLIKEHICNYSKRKIVCSFF